MAAGVAAHGIGTARAFHIDSTAGAFSGIAMGLNGALTGLILPFLRPWLGFLSSQNAPIAPARRKCKKIINDSVELIPSIPNLWCDTAIVNTIS